MTNEQSNKIALLKKLNKVQKYLTTNKINEDTIIDGIIYHNKSYLHDQVELKGYNLEKGYLVTIRETNATELLPGIIIYKPGITILHFEKPIKLKDHIIKIQLKLATKSIWKD